MIEPKLLAAFYQIRMYRLKRWIDRFNGVATKYLQHYLAWFRYLDSKEYENTQKSPIN
jgi:hypothetical protein